jgi:hypothetical protein
VLDGLVIYQNVPCQIHGRSVQLLQRVIDCMSRCLGDIDCMSRCLGDIDCMSRCLGDIDCRSVANNRRFDAFLGNNYEFKT